MRYKTFFRLVLKLMGVYFVVIGLSSAAMMSFNILVGIALSGGRKDSWFSLLSLISSLLEIAIGLYLFFGGKWIVDKAIPSNRPYCHECGYDLTGETGDVCNECGTPFRSAQMPIPMADVHH